MPRHSINHSDLFLRGINSTFDKSGTSLSQAVIYSYEKIILPSTNPVPPCNKPFNGEARRQRQHIKILTEISFVNKAAAGRRGNHSTCNNRTALQHSYEEIILPSTKGSPRRRAVLFLRRNNSTFDNGIAQKKSRTIPTEK